MSPAQKNALRNSGIGETAVNIVHLSAKKGRLYGGNVTALMTGSVSVYLGITWWWNFASVTPLAYLALESLYRVSSLILCQ